MAKVGDPIQGFFGVLHRTLRQERRIPIARQSIGGAWMIAPLKITLSHRKKYLNPIYGIYNRIIQIPIVETQRCENGAIPFSNPLWETYKPTLITMVFAIGPIVGIHKTLSFMEIGPFPQCLQAKTPFFFAGRVPVPSDCGSLWRHILPFTESGPLPQCLLAKSRFS